MTKLLIRLLLGRQQTPANNAARTRAGALAGVVGLLCNLLLCVSKFAAGLLSGSVSIMADAVNNLSDAASSIITLVGFKLGGKPADREHPFGHARMEYLAGLSVALLIMAIGVELARTSFEKILHPSPVTFSLLAIGILAASILVKLWMSRFYKLMAKEIDSTTLVAAGMDSRNDVLTTAAVLVAAVLAKLTGLELDGWMGLAVALFILWGGVGIVKDTINPLLGEAPDPELVDRLDAKILSYDGVLGLHDLMVHDYGPTRRFASVHVEMNAKDNVIHCHDIVDNIERAVLEEDGIHLVIHMDPISNDDSEIVRCRTIAANVARGVDERLTIHDFRMVQGDDHTNLIFDVVVPAGFELPQAKLKKLIADELRRQNDNFFAVITVDYSYASGMTQPEKTE